MNEVLIKRDSIPEYLLEIFKGYSKGKDYITINDMLDVIDELNYKINDLKDQIEELESPYNPEEDCMYIAKIRMEDEYGR